MQEREPQSSETVLTQKVIDLKEKLKSQFPGVDLLRFAIADTTSQSTSWGVDVEMRSLSVEGYGQQQVIPGGWFIAKIYALSPDRACQENSIKIVYNSEDKCDDVFGEGPERTPLEYQEMLRAVSTCELKICGE